MMALTDVERPHVAALGYLPIQVNYLDEALVDLYHVVAGTNEVDTLRAVRELTLGGLRTLTVRAYEARITDPELRRQFDDVKVQLDRAVFVRNDYVHARYVFGFKSGIQHTRRPRSGPVVDVRASRRRGRAGRHIHARPDALVDPDLSPAGRAAPRAGAGVGRVGRHAANASSNGSSGGGKDEQPFRP
jgi:hypothetical protein